MPRTRSSSFVTPSHAMRVSIPGGVGCLVMGGPLTRPGTLLCVATSLVAGSTSPQSIDPLTGREYGKTFPDVSVKDTVRLQLQLLQDGIGVSSIKTVIGGSFGGMQATEYAVQGGIPNGDFCTEDGKSSDAAETAVVASRAEDGRMELC
jgi:hypothetical protein